MTTSHTWPGRATHARRLLLVTLALLALTTATAGADDGDGDAEDKRGEVAVAVVVAGADGGALPTAVQATLQVSMERALERDARLDAVDQDDRLAAMARKVPKDAVAEARALVAAGETLLQRDKPKLALLKLQGASVELARVLAWTSKQDLARAQFLLGAAQAMAGDDKAAVATFTALHVWRPDAVPDADVAPKLTLPLWEKARTAVEELGTGSLIIDSAPAGALAYVDGKLVGFTPTQIDDLKVGVHYITLRRDGFERRVEAVKIGTKGPARLSAVLVPSVRAADLAAARTVFAAGIESPEAKVEARAALAEVGALIDVEHVVLLVPGKKEGQYQAAVYATDGGARLASTTIKIGDDDPETAFARAATKLYDQVAKAERAARRGPRRRIADPAERSVLKSPWFWGGVVTIAAVAIAVPLLTAEDEPLAGCPTDSSCGTVLFRF